MARNCSFPWMKWEGECNLVQPSGKNSPRAKLKGYMCLCKGDLCNNASGLLGLGLLATTLVSLVGALFVGRFTQH
ncbi:unnamed protein product [Notodromas monacha]|uniref:Protein sleepless n=1 Tax=Notodromas monacha TaxID=399045 RepID=A0A7R9BXN5_9CRUS|nr:unnamed protein product [Notodromas monacha]CAG0922027.1 unnamed protein product [Notodromas monacha]